MRKFFEGIFLEFEGLVEGDSPRSLASHLMT